MTTTATTPRPRAAAPCPAARHAAPHQWHALVAQAAPAVETIADFLQHAEVVSLLVCALEARHTKLAQFLFAHAHMLLLGDERKKRTSVLHCAAAHGRIAVVQWILRHRSMQRNDTRAAAKAAARDCVQRFDYQTLLPHRQRCDHARLAAMAWVNRNTPYTFPPDVMYEAARRGDLSVVAWLHTTSSYESYRAMEFAASCGHLDVAQWLYSHRASVLRTSLTTADATTTKIYMLVPLRTDSETADAASRPAVMNWITVFPTARYFREAFATRDGLYGAYDQRDDSTIDWTSAESRDAAFQTKRFKAIDLAATIGDLALVKRLHRDGKWPCSPLAMDGAARMGHLDVVQWLHANRTEGCTSNAIAAAAGNGHFAVVQYLHTHRTEGCRAYAVDLAASHGHLAILQWLYATYPRYACSHAFIPCIAEGNHMDVLEWLYDAKDLRLDVQVLEAAITGGHDKLVQWLLARVPGLETQLTPLVVAKAARSGHTELTQWLVRDCGLWSPRALASAAVAQNLTLVQWLHATGNPSDCVSSRELSDLGRVCAFDVVKWLLVHNLARPTFESTSSRELSALLAQSPRPTRAKTTATVIITSTSSPSARTRQSPSSDGFLWDQHTKEYPSWVRTYARLVFAYAPDVIPRIDAGPMLAAQRGDAVILEHFAASGHAAVYTKQTLHALTSHTTAGAIVQWLDRTRPETATATGFFDASVIAWAAQYALSGLLEYFFSLHDRVDVRFRRHAFETAVQTAARHGHVALLTWLVGTIEPLVTEPQLARHSGGKDASLWRTASVDAAANGQIAVLAWIAQRYTSVLDTDKDDGAWYEVLADAAAASGQLRVLQWLDAAMARRRGSDTASNRVVIVSDAGLTQALANKHVDVLQWALDRSERSEVDGHETQRRQPSDSDLVRAIRAFAEAETRGFIPLIGASSFVLPAV